MAAGFAEIRAALARTASVLGEEADVLAALAAAIEVRAEDGTAVLSRDAVRRAPRAVARVAVRNALRDAGGLRSVSLDHVDAIVALAARPAASGRRLPLPGGREAAIHFDEVRIGPACSAAAPLDAPLEVPGEAPLPDGRWVVARATRRPGPLAVPVPAGPLVLRTRRPGDRVRSAGREMSLKRFLTDRRVPAGDRDRLPVVAAGRTVVWVDGQTVDGAPGSPRHVRLDVTAHRFTRGFPGNRGSRRTIDVQIGRGASTMESGRGPRDRDLPGLGKGEGTLMGRKPGRAAK